MDNFTESFVRDTLACAILKHYVKHICHCGGDCSAAFGQIKDIAERMLNDGTISQLAYADIQECIAQHEGQPCDKKDIPGKIAKEAIKCFIKHAAEIRIAKHGVAGELVDDLKKVQEVKASCQAAQAEFASKYNMEGIARDIISKYIPVPVTEMLSVLTEEDFSF